MREYPLLYFLLTPSTVHTTIRALTSLNVSDNHLGKKGSEAIAEALRENKVVKNLNMSKNNGGTKCAKILADGIIAKGALMSLNLADNDIAAEGAKHVAEAIKGHVSVLWPV